MTTKNITKVFLPLFFLFTLCVIVYAVPGVPHQFYGNVYLNGNPSPEGLLVTAQIDGVEIAATTVKDSKYGYMPYKFYVQDPDYEREGKKITFYVDGINAGEYIFSNGLSTSLDLSITKSVTTTTTSGGSTRSGGSASGGGAPLITQTANTTSTVNQNLTEEEQNDCTPNWECSKWLDCVNLVQSRVCVDRNNCGTNQGKPQEKQICENQEQVANLMNSVNEDPNDKGFFNFLTGRVIGKSASPMVLPALIAVLVVAVIIGSLYFRFRKDY